MSTTFLEALEIVAEASGVEFDPLVAKQALVHAERMVPGDHRDAWRERLVRAGNDLGLRVTAFRCSVREAGASASPARPVVTCPSGGPEAGSCLVVTGRRGRRVRVAEGETGRWIGEAELARTLGLGGPKEAAEWALVQPIAPCEGLGDPAAGDRAHGHGHGDHEAMSPLKRLIGLIRPEGGDIRVVVAFAVGVGVLSLATPLAVEALVTTVAMNLLVQQLVVLSFVLLVCLSLAAAMRALQTCVVEAIQQRVFVRVTSDLAYRLPRVRVDALDREYGPELVNRFFDVVTVQKVGALLLLDGIAIVLQSVIGLLLLAFYHPYLLGFSLVMLGAMAFIVFQLGRGAVATSIRESRAKYDVAGRLEELVLAPLAYKLEGGAEFAMDRADILARRYLAARRDHFRIVLRQVVFALALQAVASTALLGLGGWLVIQGQLTLGQLVAAELIVVTVVGSFTKLGKHLEGWYDLMAAVDKLGHLTDLPLERRDGEADHAKEGVGASLRLRSVAFEYDGRGPILDGLDLDVHPGERVAIVGPSGTGKSTLVDLLYGLRAPTGGHVEIDGVNLRDLRLDGDYLTAYLLSRTVVPAIPPGSV